MIKIRDELLRKRSKVSHMTVSRCLSKEFKLKSYKPAKKTRLAMKAKRVAFALKHRHWATAQWGRVIFSDESTLQQFVVHKRLVRRSVTTSNITINITINIDDETSSKSNDLRTIFKNGLGGLYFLTPGTIMNGQSI